MGQHDTACALFGPVALRAHNAIYVDHFENKWSIDAILAVDNFLPIFALPPSRVEPVELAVWLEENVCRSPNFIVDAASGGILGH